MDLDSLVSSHPIYIEVERPEDIDQIFDAISYAKVGYKFLNSSASIDIYFLDKVEPSCTEKIFKTEFI